MLESLIRELFILAAWVLAFVIGVVGAVWLA